MNSGRVLVAVLLLLALGPGPSAASPAEHLDRADRASDRSAYRRALEALQAELPADVPQELAGAIEEALEAGWPRDAQGALDRVQGRLRSWDAARTLSAAGEAEYAAVRDDLLEVLDRPEFRTASRLQELVATVEGVLEELLARLFAGRGGADLPLAGLARALAVGLMVLAVLGAASLVGLLLRSRRFRSRSAPTRSAARHEGLERSGLDWTRAAEDAEHRGDFRQALRLHFLSLLRGLHERGALDLEREATNWELVRQLSGDARGAALEAATRLFESRWYAQREASAAEVGAMAELRRELLP